MQEQKPAAINKSVNILKALIHKFTQNFRRNFSSGRSCAENKKPRRGGVIG
jgi:hypothetical protein